MTDIIDFPGNNKQPMQQTAKQSILDPFLKCKGCGGYRFVDVFLLRKVTPLQDESLLESTIVPLQLFQCINCGKLFNSNQVTASE